MFADRHVHCLGIGGYGVSALVPLLEDAGATVSGCDLARNRRCRALAARGLTIAHGHDPAHVVDADIVVYSTAVPPDHAELRTAAASGCQLLSRAACLAELMRGRPTVAVAGSHGKTTTTWLCAHLLIAAGLDPLVMVGASVPGLGGGAHVGTGDWFVAEVDESDGGFIHVDPTIAVLTNIDDEHLAHYGDREALDAAFAAWLERVPASGRIIVARDQVPETVLARVRAPVERIAIEAAEDLFCEAEASTFCYGTDLVHLPLPGRHNVLNALLAMAAARAVEPACPLAALSSCARVKRRFSVRGEPGGVRVVEDYAHHPAEITATIQAARLAGAAVHVIFQPHRYSRTVACLRGFTTCFDGAAAVAILPIYGASEEPLPGISGRSLAEAVAVHRGGGRTQYAARPAAAIAYIQSMAGPGDTVLVLGAGDVHRLVPALLETLAC